MREQAPRERRKKNYKPTIEIPPDFDPSTGSLVKALLQRDGLPVGNTAQDVKPDATSIGEVESGVRKGGNQRVRRY